MKVHCYLSIIIPIYNAEEYLQDCLSSIQKQDFGDFEVICIDDGSSDNSLEILKSFASKDSRFRLFTQENKGVSATRNFGIEQVQGELFTFVDADDILLDGAISFYKNIFENHPIDILVERGLVTFSGTEKIEVKDGEFSEILDSKSAARYFFSTGLQGYAAGKVYRTLKLQKMRFPEKLKMFEDLEMFMSLFTHDYRFLYTSGSHYGYRLHNKSATKQVNGEKRLNVLHVYCNIFRYMEQENYSKKEMGLLLRYIKIYSNWNKYFDLSESEQTQFCQYITSIKEITGKNPCDFFMRLRIYVFKGRFEKILRYGEYLYYGSLKSLQKILLKFL